MTWSRGEFRIATHVPELAVQRGHVSSCGTWGIHKVERSGYSLTHRLTGLRVTCERRLRDAQRLGELLAPLVADVQLGELSNARQIGHAIEDAIESTMIEWVKARKVSS